jgi:hypothetical protein
MQFFHQSGAVALTERFFAAIKMTEVRLSP